jgi:hypothetical protein
MVIGLLGGIDVCIAAHAACEASDGLGRGGLITIIVVSAIAIAAFVWIFRETGRRD